MEIKGTPPAAKPGGPAAKAAAEDAKLRAACTELEAVFLNILLTQMRKTVPKGGLTGGGNQEEIFRSLLDSETTKNMARAGGVGLADTLYRQLSPTAGAARKTNNKGQAPE